MKNYVLFIILPMILSNVIHMLMVKGNHFSFLKIPISESFFGINKTWRGFVFLSTLNGLFTWLLSSFIPFPYPVHALLLGCLVGFAYMLFELPNSWLKRQAGIAPGDRAKKHGWIFMVLDKSDSSFGVTLVCAFLLNLDFKEAIQLFLIATGTHIVFSWLLVSLRLKKRF